MEVVASLRLRLPGIIDEDTFSPILILIIDCAQTQIITRLFSQLILFNLIYFIEGCFHWVVSSFKCFTINLFCIDHRFLLYLYIIVVTQQNIDKKIIRATNFSKHIIKFICNCNCASLGGKP